ncbi:MAG: hypothetical protein HQL87_09465 [Magnetococcales bacterium]|nr:hypothetical protein [Magnetococcales bacterium]
MGAKPPQAATLIKAVQATFAMRLFSSQESVANGEPSWLAVLETLWATLLCWGMVWHGHTPWPVLLPLAMAPLLLLRSPASTAQGARWFAAYLADKTEITPFKTPLQFWGILVPLIVSVTSLCTSILAEHWLPNQTDWALFIRATLVGVVAMWIAMAIAVAGAMVGAVAVALTVAFSLALGAARAGVAEVAFAWALAVTLVGMVAAIVALMWMGSVAGEGELAVAIVLAGIPWIIGIWVRSLGVRLVATLCHPWRGLCAVPDNWRRVVWGLDFRHPPELVPELSLWTPAFSLAEIRAILRSSGILRKLFGLLAFGCFFLPALLYRWSLKSTIWFYWPLLYLEAVPRGRDPVVTAHWRAALREGHRERMRRWWSVLLLLAMGGVVFCQYHLDYVALPAWLEQRVFAVSLLAVGQGCAVAMALLSWAIQGVNRRGRAGYGLRGLVWLRNGCAVLWLGITVWWGGLVLPS